MSSIQHTLTTTSEENSQPVPFTKFHEGNVSGIYKSDGDIHVPVHNIEHIWTMACEDTGNCLDLSVLFAEKGQVVIGTDLTDAQNQLDNNKLLSENCGLNQQAVATQSAIAAMNDFREGLEL